MEVQCGLKADHRAVDQSLFGLVASVRLALCGWLPSKLIEVLGLETTFRSECFAGLSVDKLFRTSQASSLCVAGLQW